MTMTGDTGKRETAPFSIVRGVAYTTGAGALLAGAALWFWRDTAFARAAIPILLPCWLGLEASALTAALVEYGERLEWLDEPRRGGRIVALAGLAACVALLIWTGMATPGVMAACQVSGAMGIVTGILAQGRKNAWINGPVPLALIALLPLFLMMLPLLASAPAGLAGWRMATAPAALLTGPWCAHAVRLIGLPHPGQGFHLPLAISLSVVLALVTLIALAVQEKKASTYALVFVSPVYFAWVALAAWQLTLCAQ